VNQVPYWGLGYIRCHGKIFSRHGNLAYVDLATSALGIERRATSWGSGQRTDLAIIFIVPRLTIREILYCVCTWDLMCIWVRMVHTLQCTRFWMTRWELRQIDIGTKRHRQGRHSIVRLESWSPSDTTSAYVWLCAV